MINRDVHSFELPFTQLGTTYPTGYVTAMFPTDDAALMASGALGELGFTWGDQVMASGLQLLENEQNIGYGRGIGIRLLGIFPGVEAEIVKRYHELATQGYAVLAVRVSSFPGVVRQQVVATLHQYQGCELHYFGMDTIEDL